MTMAYCYDGKTYETIKEMAEEYGIDRQRIYSFRRRGWSLEDAMQMCVNDVRGRGRLFEYNGKLYRSPKALAEEYGLPWNSLAHYIQRCKTVEEAVDRCKEAQEKKIMLHKTVWIYFFDMRNYFKSNPNVRESGGNKDKGEWEKKRGEEL